MSRTVHVLAGLLLLGIGFAAGWLVGNGGVYLPPGNHGAFPYKIETKPGNGATLVWIKSQSRPHGAWHPLVGRTTSPIEELFGDEIAGAIVVHLNKDGTAVVSDGADAAKRRELEKRGVHGWPRD